MRIRDVPPAEILADGTVTYDDGLSVRIGSGARPSALSKTHNGVQYETWLAFSASMEESNSITIEYRWGKEN